LYILYNYFIGYSLLVSNAFIMYNVKRLFLQFSIQQYVKFNFTLAFVFASKTSSISSKQECYHYFNYTQNSIEWN